MIRTRFNWTSAALGLILIAVVALFITGRLQFQWRPEHTGARDAEKDEHGHAKDADQKESQAEEGSRIVGDKAVLDADALEVSDIRSASVEKGSVAVTLQVTGEVRLPDERLAQVTPRVAGVVREIHKARGDRVAAGTPLATIDSADLGETRAAYAAALSELKIAERNYQQWQNHRQSGFTPAPDGAGAVGWIELDQAMAEHASALTEKSLADRTLARMQELHDRGLRSRTELLAAEAEAHRAAVKTEGAARRLIVLGAVADNERTKARQRADAARAKLRAVGLDAAEGRETDPGGGRPPTSRFVVRSPIAGVVSDRQVTLGESVEPTSKIFSIADLAELWVTGALYDKDVAAVRPGMNATVRVQGLSDTAFRGQVSQLGPQVDEKTRTLPVRVVVRNQSLGGGSGGQFALRPGMFATVELETSRKTDVVRVPLSAIQTVEGKETVFVETTLTDGAAFQRRAVVLGTRDEKVAEVVEGVTEGERVVVTNAYLLKSEFERAKISHGHAH